MDATQFKVGDVCFDTEMKEHVLITNGECVLDHSSPEAYKKSHEGHDECVYAPHECIAIRCIGTEVIEATDSIVPLCAWTYRGCNPEHLKETDITKEQFEKWLEACPTGRI